jgi:hypothetical protein
MSHIQNSYISDFYNNSNNKSVQNIKISTSNYGDRSNAENMNSNYSFNGLFNNNSVNSTDELKSLLLGEVRVLKEENVRLKQRLNEFELRQDQNDIKLDAVIEIVNIHRMNVIHHKTNEGIEKENSTSEAIAVCEKLPEFLPDLFSSYLNEKSGIFTNLLLRSDKPEHHWVQQLRFFLLLFIYINL